MQRARAPTRPAVPSGGAVVCGLTLRSEVATVLPMTHTLTTAPAAEPATDIHGPRVDGNIIAIFKSRVEARRVARRLLLSGIAVPVHTRFQSLYAIKADNGEFYTRDTIAALQTKHDARK